MRKFSSALLLAGLALPAVALSAVGAQGVVGHRASGTSCSKASGTLTFTPPIPVKGPVTVTITNKGTVGGCTGSVFTGAVTGTLHYAVKVDCSTLLANKTFPTGTESIKWNVTSLKPSSLAVKGVAYSGASALDPKTTGTVTAGQFKGLHSSQIIHISKINPASGACSTAALKSVGYVQKTALVIK
jgi:hypothetical protein